MRKIFNYFILKINSVKIYMIFAIVLVYQFGLFFRMIFQPIRFNYYDLVMKEFGYLSLFYCLSLFYLIIIYNVCEKNDFHKYLLLKFKGKTNVFNSNIFIIFAIAVILIMLLNILPAIESLGIISFKNEWSEYFSHAMTGKVNLIYADENIKFITNKLTPFSYIIYMNLLALFYLFYLGMIFLVSNLYLKKRIYSFFLVLLMNLLSIVFDSTNGIVGKLIFTNNIYFITANIRELNSNMFIVTRILYWSILIAITYLIGKILCKKIDYNFGD